MSDEIDKIPELKNLFNKLCACAKKREITVESRKEFFKALVDFEIAYNKHVDCHSEVPKFPIDELLCVMKRKK